MAIGTPAAARNSDIVTKPLDVTTRQQLAQLPHVIDVYPEFRFTGDLRFGPAGHLTPITSLPISAAGSDSLDDMQGHFFSSPNAHEVILQTDVAADLADSQHLQPAEMLGKDLVLRYAGREPLTPPAGSGARDRNAGRANDHANDRDAAPDDDVLGFSVISSRVSLRVVGIVATEAVASGASAFGRSGAYVPVAVAEELGVVQGNDMGEVIRESTLGEGGRHYSNLTVRVERPADVPAVEDAVRQMGYSPFSLLDLTRNLRRLFAILDMLLGIFGSLALAVASLGIINTLVMAILERRREIGVLKALGASDQDVRQLFFAEAGVMGLLGGVMGVVLGWGIGRAIQLAHQLLPEPATDSAGKYLDRAGLAGGFRHRFLAAGQPGCGNLSGQPRRPPRSGRSPALRVSRSVRMIPASPLLTLSEIQTF